MIYGIAIAVITLVIDLWTDIKRWTDGRGVSHVRGAALRAIGLIPASILLGWWAPLMLGLYMILFNGILARLKGLSFWYLGTTSAIDRLLNRLPKWGYIALQGVLLAGSVLIGILMK